MLCVLYYVKLAYTCQIAEYIGAADQVLYMYPISPSIVFTGVYFNAVKVYLV